MVDEIWKGTALPSQLDPPPPNQLGTVPYSRLIYNIDNLESIFYAVSVDTEVAGFIQKKSPIFNEENCTRQKVTVSLMGYKDVFNLDVWIIPVFLDGVLTSQLYAADDENQQKILKYRNPVRPNQHDYNFV